MADSERQKLVFFIETKKAVGGSVIMFLEIGSYIAEHYPEYDVYYVNNSNDKLEEIYGSNKLKMMDVEKVDFSMFEGSVFFTPYNYIFELAIRARNLKDARVMLYFYHQEIMTWLDNQMRSPVIDMLPFLRLMSEKNGYAFMDCSCYSTVSSRLPGINLQKKYIPVPVKGNADMESVELIDNGKLNIGWLGRLDRDKIFSVTNLADNLFAMGSKKTIDLHIIGDGNSKAILDVCKYSPQIRFIFTSNLYGEVRDRYIRENVDIMVAMGMSATDTSQLKIPTVFPIVSPREFFDNKYIYLFDTREFAIGWDPVEIKGSGCTIHTIEEVIDDIYAQGMKIEYGEACCGYAREAFSMKNCADHMIPLIDECGLTISECISCRPIKKLLRRYDRFVRMTGIEGYEAYHGVASFFRFDNFKARGLKDSVTAMMKMAVTFLRGERNE